MQIIAGELRENGIPEKNLIFLNLDKRGYKNIRTAEQLEDLLDQVCTGPGIKYLFIDEIQNVKGFEEVLMHSGKRMSIPFLLPAPIHIC